MHDKSGRSGDRNHKGKKRSAISHLLISHWRSMGVFTVYDNTGCCEKWELPPSDKLVNSGWLIHVICPTEDTMDAPPSYSTRSIRHSCHMVWITHALCTDHVKLSRSPPKKHRKHTQKAQRDNSLFHKDKKLFITQVWKAGKYQIFCLSVIASCG